MFTDAKTLVILYFSEFESCIPTRR